MSEHAATPPRPHQAAAAAGLNSTPSRPLLAAETTRLYAADWVAFAAWCRRAGAPALPAAADQVAAFLQAEAATLGAGALVRRAAAIADRHRRAGLATPNADPRVRAVLRAARQTATRRRQPAPPPGQLARMAAACPGDHAGLRDRALLLLAAAGLGRKYLVSLLAEDVRFVETGVQLIWSRLGDHRMTLPRTAARDVCPVRALEAWLQSSDTRFGPVFRKVSHAGTLDHQALGTDAMRRILLRRALPRSHAGKAAPRE